LATTQEVHYRGANGKFLLLRKRGPDHPGDSSEGGETNKKKNGEKFWAKEKKKPLWGRNLPRSKSASRGPQKKKKKKKRVAANLCRGTAVRQSVSATKRGERPGTSKKVVIP